jgi:hypothetical protein
MKLPLASSNDADVKNDLRQEIDRIQWLKSLQVKFSKSPSDRQADESARGQEGIRHQQASKNEESLRTQQDCASIILPCFLEEFYNIVDSLSSTCSYGSSACSSH